MFNSVIKKIVKNNLERQKNPTDFSYLKKITLEEIDGLGKIAARQVQKRKMSK